jgi:dTMP kinase
VTGGRYVVLEGGDGTGKSLQAAALVDWLRPQGFAVRHLREPGSTPTGEALRRLLLDPSTCDLEPLTEALLFSAARGEMLRREVRPAVAAGEIVLVERCYLSTLVYQGVARGQPLELLHAITAAVHGELWPDRVFVLDVDEATRRARADGAQKADRIEARGSAFHERVRRGYIEVADPRVAIVDARPAAADVQAGLRRMIEPLLVGVSR